MQEELEPIRNRRKEFEKDIPAIYEMLRKGCEVARAAAADTLSDVRKAMKINYFDDAELINEQVSIKKERPVTGSITGRFLLKKVKSELI